MSFLAGMVVFVFIVCVVFIFSAPILAMPGSGQCGADGAMELVKFDDDAVVEALGALPDGVRKDLEPCYFAYFLSYCCIHVRELA